MLGSMQLSHSHSHMKTLYSVQVVDDEMDPDGKEKLKFRTITIACKFPSTNDLSVMQQW